MNKKLFSRVISAVLCSATIISVPQAAFAAQKAVLLDATAGSNILAAENEFASDTQGWNTEGAEISAESGAAVVSPSGSGSYGINTAFGSGLYRNASTEEGLYWDFESADDISDNVDLDETSDLGKWAAARKSTPYTRMLAADVELYNHGQYEAKTESGEDLNDEANPAKAEDKAIPAEGSTNCLEIENPKNKAWSAVLGARAKISRDMVVLGEEYTLKFWFMHNTKPRPLYAGIAPYSETEMTDCTDGNAATYPIIVTNEDKTYNEDVNIVPMEGGKAARQWTEYSIKIVPTAEDFNDDGYATIWILSVGSFGLNKTAYDIYPYEKFYLDNVSFTRDTNAAKTTDFTFLMKVKGKAGSKISVSANIDDEYTIFETSKTIAKDDTWETVSTPFAVDSDMYFLKGKNAGSAFAAGNDRVVLNISSSAADGFSADDIYIMKNLSRDELEKSGGQSVCFIFDVYGLSSIKSAQVECKSTGGKFFNKSTPIDEGRQSLFFKCTAPSTVSGDVTLNIKSYASSFLEKECLLFPLYKNGNNVYPKAEALKLFGAGRYLVEFDTEGGTAADSANVKLGTAEATADIFDGGKGVAEVVMTESDISSLTDTSAMTVECEKTVSNITVKKVADK